RVDSADAFWETLAGAVRAALGPRQGPAVLLIPRDAYELEVPPRPAWFPRALATLARAPAPTREKTRELFDAIKSARRPVMILGASRSRGADVAARFAIEAGVPVATTMANCGAFPNGHPLYLGTIGAAGHPSAHAYVNERAD